MKALMHLDGCHFYVWVREDGRLGYGERTGDNLMLYRSDEPCERCTALSRGSRPRHFTRQIEVPEDSKALVYNVFEAIGEIQSTEHERDDERTESGTG